MLNFEMHTNAVDGGLHWELRGDLDIETVPLALAQLADIEDADPGLLIVDLSGLSFMDSTGLGLVVAAHARAIEHERRCVVVRPREPVDKAFSLTGLADVLDTVRSLDELELPGA
jgi:anti-anti-sigma factor